MDDGRHGELARRLSEEFINAQNSLERTRLELLRRGRQMKARIDSAIDELEKKQGQASLADVVGLSEDAMGVERLARLLEDQRELIESAIDNTRAVTRRRLR